MRIVLPGALPEPSAARELTPHLLKAAPTLARWMQQSRALETPVDSSRTGCTAHEQWLLRSAGFKPEGEQNLCAGLAPLKLIEAARNGPDSAADRRDGAAADPATPSATEYTRLAASCGVAPDTPVWLAELVHMSPSRDGAGLLPAKQLAISAHQSDALFETAQALFQESEFKASRLDPTHWRIALPAGFAPLCASPDLVGATSVNDWWPQDIASRPWRRLVNELQMLWFEHPVNRARYDQGLPPVNSLWLFGGAAPRQFGRAHTRPDPSPITCDTLLAPCLAQDWGGWIAALAELESRVFLPRAQSRPSPDIVLIGTRRIIELKPARLGGWNQWLPGGRNAWRKWWSPRN